MKIEFGLWDAENVARRFKMSPEELLDLAESGYVPHYRLNGSAPLFKLSEVREWVKNNLLSSSGGKALPQVIRVFDGNEPKRGDIPESIRRVQGLRDISAIILLSPGIYFLCQGSEVVYVGQSVNVPSRLGQHTDKEFDRVFFLPWPQNDLNRVESAFIRLLCPPFNGRQKNGKPIAPLSVSEEEGARGMESRMQEVGIP